MQPIINWEFHTVMNFKEKMNLKHFFAKSGFIWVFVITCLGCEKALHIKNPTTTPVAVYDDLWNALDKNYALFKIKNIDWDSINTYNRPEFRNDLSTPDLFSKCGKMLEALKDGHVSLISNDRTYIYEYFHTGYLTNFNLTNIQKNYLANQFQQLGPVIYKVVDEIGYVHYGSFRENISEAQLGTFFNDIAATKGLIIDVRNNSGGSLTNVEKFFSRFINAKKLVKYELKKKGPGRNDFYEKEPSFISPAGTFYDKPIVVLTNRTCFSACNDFVLYMSNLPNVRIVGDQTGGGGAIPANYLLVNGWKLQYSSSVTLSPDGIPVENGILPDYVVNISPIEEGQGKDPILEKGYQLLQ